MTQARATLAHMTGLARTFCLVSLIATLGACGAWPDVPAPDSEISMTGWPRLQPLSDAATSDAGVAEERARLITVEERAAALRARAAVLRQPVGDTDDFEALRAALAQ